MRSQEVAGAKALAKHQPDRSIRNGQINCTCGKWKTETVGQDAQEKSFRRHQIREVLAAIRAVTDPRMQELVDRAEKAEQTTEQVERELETAKSEIVRSMMVSSADAASFLGVAVDVAIETVLEIENGLKAEALDRGKA